MLSRLVNDVRPKRKMLSYRLWFVFQVSYLKLQYNLRAFHRIILTIAYLNLGDRFGNQTESKPNYVVLITRHERRVADFLIPVAFPCCRPQNTLLSPICQPNRRSTSIKQKSPFRFYKDALIITDCFVFAIIDNNLEKVLL